MHGIAQMFVSIVFKCMCVHLLFVLSNITTLDFSNIEKLKYIVCPE